MNKFLLLTLLLFLAAGKAYAQTEPVGAVELNLLNVLLTGNLGFALGLVVCVMGIYSIAKGNASAGILLVVLGVLVTLTPAFYNSARTLLCPMVTALSGGEAHCGEKG